MVDGYISFSELNNNKILSTLYSEFLSHRRDKRRKDGQKLPLRIWPREQTPNLVAQKDPCATSAANLKPSPCHNLVHASRQGR